MVAITVDPIVLRDVTLTVGADSYEAHVSGVTFNPSASTVTWQGLTPSSTFTGSSTATWDVTLSYAQDWATVNSLSAYLFNNEGAQVEMTFAPKAGGASFAATVIITPGAIGGDVNSVATASVTLGVVGKPVISTPA